MTAPVALSNSSIRELAEGMGNAFRIYDAEGRADLDFMLQEMNAALVVSSEMSARESSTVDADGNLTIFIPPMTSSKRDRFTIAHELGHYFLHYLYAGEIGEKTFGRGERNRAETQANVFAASLLMPADRFKSKFNEAGEDFWKLARAFGVSPAAARVRAEVLSLI